MAACTTAVDAMCCESATPTPEPTEGVSFATLGGGAAALLHGAVASGPSGDAGSAGGESGVSKKAAKGKEGMSAAWWHKSTLEDFRS